jgi:hypothetical protein
MENLLIILSFLFSSLLFGQNSEKKDMLSCDSINNSISDEKLYDTLSNGKLIFRPDLYKSEIYRITADKKGNYYVTEEIMKKIRKSRCPGVTIQKLKWYRNKKNQKFIVF